MGHTPAQAAAHRKSVTRVLPSRISALEDVRAAAAVVYSSRGTVTTEDWALLGKALARFDAMEVERQKGLARDAART
jgi:hypothetical protein